MLKNRNNSSDLMVVYTTHVFEEAHIISGKLQSHDIPAMVDREAAAQALGLTLGRLGELRVLVREQDYHRAIELLAESDESDEFLLDEPDDVIYYYEEPDDDE